MNEWAKNYFGKFALLNFKEGLYVTSMFKL